MTRRRKRPGRNVATGCAMPTHGKKSGSTGAAPGHGSSGSNESRWNRKDLWFAVVSISAALLLYGRALPAPMFWDDHVHLWVVQHVPWSWFLDHGMLKVYFRPLGGLVWWVAGRLFGSSPLPLHVLNLVLLGVIVLLLYRLGRRLGGSERTAGMVALLVVANPVTAATVAWAANVYTMLCVALGLAAVDLAFAWTTGWAAWTPVVIVGLSALAKEEAVVFLPAVVYVTWRRGSGSRARLLHAVAVVGAVAAAFLWRETVLGGFGGVADLSSFIGPRVVVGGLVAMGVVAALWFSWSSTWWRLGLLLVAPAGALSVLMVLSVPRDPHGVYLRLFFALVVGSAVLAGAGLARASASSRAVRHAAVAVMVVLLAAGGLLAAGRVGGWLRLTRASDALVERTCRVLQERGLGAAGPVWVEGAGDEIALDAAVKLRHPEWSRSLVVLRPAGINFVVTPAPMWGRVAPLLALQRLPGNPARIGQWKLGVGFGRRSRWRAARAGRAPEP
ncbi:MAG: hypothetical protein GXP48_11895, partial [Acidobacteria bacterium]|nr:hypothetical protein [Acidobacteriota bacterium]